MPILSDSSPTIKTALSLTTVGALLDVWAGVWFYYLNRVGASGSGAWYFCTGLLLSGLVLIVVGLLSGPIGRLGRRAELPPASVTDAVARAEMLAAAAPPPVAGPGTRPTPNPPMPQPR